MEPSTEKYGIRHSMPHTALIALIYTWPVCTCAVQCLPCVPFDIVWRLASPKGLRDPGHTPTSTGGIDSNPPIFPLPRWLSMGVRHPFRTAGRCCIAQPDFSMRTSYLPVCDCCLQSLVADESFQHILRVLNTNVDGKQKIMFALTSIKGIGRRFANLVCKKAEVDMNKR